MGIVLLQEMIPVKSWKIEKKKKIDPPPCFFKKYKKYEKNIFYANFLRILVKLRAYFPFLVKMVQYWAQKLEKMHLS